MDSPAPKRTIVIDIDGTILSRSFLDSLRLYLGKTDRVGHAFAVMPQIITELSSQYRIVALTARAERGRRNTLSWLSRHGLPFVEVVHSPQFQLMESSRKAFKTAAIAHLLDSGYEIAYGVGDRMSDFESYVANKIFPLVVLRPHQRGRKSKILALAAKLGLAESQYAVFEETVESPAWPAIQKFIAEHNKA
ncbi:MAG: hypothetical protein WC712_14100 [Candidatus Brocadiia bacterium]